MEQKLKHLEFIQSDIRQLTSRIFLLRGWSITLIAFLLVATAITRTGALFLLVFFVALMFWVLEGYLLSHELRFTALYDHVRSQGEGQIDFSMSTEAFDDKHTCQGAMFSKGLLLYYGIQVVAIIVVELAIMGAFS